MSARPLPADDGPPIDLVRARLARIAEESGLSGRPGLAGLSPADDHTRVRAERWRAEVLARAGEHEVGAAGAFGDELPVPGRHAARRGARPGLLGRVRDRVPSPALALLDRSRVPEPPYAAEPPPATTGGGGGPGPGRGPRGAAAAPGRRIAIGPAQVAVLAVLVATALAATCWWVLAGRADEQVVEPLAVTTSAAGTPLATAADPVPPVGGDAASEPGSTATDAQGEVVVHVAGRVARPGIVVLPGGSRVADALQAAGGTVPDTDLTGLNLARVLVDGEQVLVGVDPSEGAPAAPGGGAPGATGGAGAPPAGGLVDLNTADLAALDLLPGVGPVTAQAIIDWREENGGFSHVDELLEVKGIGEATLAELAPLVTV